MKPRHQRRLLLLGVMLGMSMTMSLVGTSVPSWLVGGVALMTGVMTAVWWLS